MRFLNSFLTGIVLAFLAIMPAWGVTVVVVQKPVVAGGGGKPSGYYLWFKPESLAGYADTVAIDTWADSGSAAKDATAAGASRPLCAAGFFDGLNCANANGTTRVMATASVTHGIGTGDFTWTKWVRITTASAYTGSGGNGSFAPGFYVKLTGTNWGINWGSDYVSGNALSTDTWYHLTVMRSGTTIKFFQDGTQTGTTHTLSTSMSNAVFKIMDSGGGGGFLGYLGEQTCWARALSDQEVMDDKNTRSP